MSTLTLPAIPRIAQLRPKDVARQHWYDDRWHVTLLILATFVGTGAAIVTYLLHANLLYADAHSHLQISRRVLDNLKPGLAQLGTVWLPLPHLAMIPFIWNTYLWSSGLAGTLASVPSYLLATNFIFLSARRLTHNSWISFVSSLVFVLNPNILYLQSTPLSEPVLFATLCVASYYFLAWTQDDQLSHLITAAFWTFLATLARYDGWALFLSILVMVPVVGFLRHTERSKILADTLMFGIMGGLGIFLWFLWNMILFGDPLYFATGPASSAVQTQQFIQHGWAPTYHNLVVSLKFYILATLESVGPLIFGIGVLGLVFLFISRRFSPELIGVLIFFVPFPFYVVAFYTGQDVMFVPHANVLPFFPLFNARFGAEMTAPAAISVALFLQWLEQGQHRLQPIKQSLSIFALGMLVVQPILTANGGIITLQDGQYGASCEVTHSVVTYLAEHYNGGRILIDTYKSPIDLSQAGINFREEIYQGDEPYWSNSLAQPASNVTWMIITPGDLITQSISLQSTTFLKNYQLVDQEAIGTMLFERQPNPDPVARPLSSLAIQPYGLCDIQKNLTAVQVMPSPTAEVWRAGLA